jgi:hypothetical protein
MFSGMSLSGTGQGVSRGSGTMRLQRIDADALLGGAQVAQEVHPAAWNAYIIEYA